MTNAVQSTVRDMRNRLSRKINRIPVSYFDKHQFGDLIGALYQRCGDRLECTPTKLSLLGGQCRYDLILVIRMVLYLNIQLALIISSSIPLTYFWS